jgi:hypothetical protein
VVREAGDRIVGDVQQFLGNQPPSDDMCLVGWGRMGDDAGPVGGLLETKLGMSSQVTQRISQVS